MIQAQRKQVNQKLYQAGLFLQAATELHQDELTLLAWQQACYEAALNALEAARLAFWRELAAASGLPAQAVNSLADLHALAVESQRQLPELTRFEQAFTDPSSPLNYFNSALARLRRVAAASPPPVEPSSPAELLAVEPEQSQEEEQLADAAKMLDAMRALIQELRGQLLED